MTITFRSDNEVIIYSLERIISYARNYQYIFVAQIAWWLVSVLSLKQGLITHIYTLRNQEVNTRREERSVRRGHEEDAESDYLPTQVHQSRIPLTTSEQELSPTP